MARSTYLPIPATSNEFSFLQFLAYFEDFVQTEDVEDSCWLVRPDRVLFCLHFKLHFKLALSGERRWRTFRVTETNEGKTFTRSTLQFGVFAKSNKRQKWNCGCLHVTNLLLFAFNANNWHFTTEMFTCAALPNRYFISHLECFTP